MKPSFHSLTTISTWNQSKKTPNQIGLTGFRDKVATQLLTSGGRTFTADCLSWQRTGKQNILWSLKSGACAFNWDLPDRARREFSFGESYAIFTHAPQAIGGDREHAIFNAIKQMFSLPGPYYKSFVRFVWARARKTTGNSSVISLQASASFSCRIWSGSTVV